MKKAILFFMLCALLVPSALSAQGTPTTASKVRRQQVYMFGVAASMTDSVAFITDLQSLDVYILPNGFLADRSLYSLQLNNYMVGKRGIPNMACTVFFDKKKAKAEKKFQKVRKKYRQTNQVIMQPLGYDLFQFRPEEWVETK